MVEENNGDPPRLVVEYTASIVTPPRIIMRNKPPSYFLSHPAYLQLANSNIRGVVRMEIEPVGEDETTFVDNLGRILHRRLSKHIRIKITDYSKHNHLALIFLRENLIRFAALISFFGQARTSTVMNQNSLLLEHPSRGSFVLAEDRELEGSYLHYSVEDFQWIRSGKAVGSDDSRPVNGLVRRNEEGHAKKSQTASLVSGECFYTLYPSRMNKNQLPNILGYFEDLSLYCGLSFKRSENVNGLISTVDNECLFDWSVYMTHLDKANIRGCNTLREKQLVVVGYFFELCYDLCLSPRNNVSNNPGFNSILGVFNNIRQS